MIIFGIIGWKNSGKTHLVQKIISAINSKKLNVASIKHAHHSFDIDQPGTDSYLHRQSGADQVIISSANRWAKITELKTLPEKKLSELVSEINSADVVIVEGFKNENHPKIEIIKEPDDESSYIFKKITNVVALVSDKNINSFENKQFKKNEINEIVNFILSKEYE
tara:strand:- start:5284 stop:5781 length:498 start_codon:yes stop_codon:yes gene_type:complete